MSETITTNRLFIDNFKFNASDLKNGIIDILSDFDYESGDTSYKFQGVLENIKMANFIIKGTKYVDHYTEFIITVEINIESAKTIKEKGKNFVTGKGLLVIKSELNYDYDKIWIENPILHFLKKIYEKYFYKSTIDSYIGKIGDETVDIKEKIKELVNFKR